MSPANPRLLELLALPANERSEVAEALLISLEEEHDVDADHAWAEEITRRVEANEPGIAADAVFAEARQRIRK